MKREVADKEMKELTCRYEKLYSDICSEMDGSPYFPDEDGRDSIKRNLVLKSLSGFNIITILGWIRKDYYFSTGCEDDSISKFDSSEIVSKIKECSELKDKINSMERLVDMEKEFCGDIIITDPCYIIRAKHHGTEPITKNDWEACGYGDNMEALGIHNYLVRDTLYGDWSCTTFDKETKKPIGEFCADAGLVGVFLLDEVLKYNPDFNYHIERPWTTTWIKNFKGVISLEVVHTEGVYEDDTEWHRKGQQWEDDSVQVHGCGINTLTGEPINFVGMQTGF